MAYPEHGAICRFREVHHGLQGISSFGVIVAVRLGSDCRHDRVDDQQLNSAFNRPRCLNERRHVCGWVERARLSVGCSLRNDEFDARQVRAHSHEPRLDGVG
ncbi:MAG TPA: hypothetical protein VGP28_04340 [Methylocella sp.]|nr:hypothetical protein [Methylocella sp.]